MGPLFSSADTTSNVWISVWPHGRVSVMQVTINRPWLRVSKPPSEAATGVGLGSGQSLQL